MRSRTRFHVWPDSDILGPFFRAGRRPGRGGGGTPRRALRAGKIVDFTGFQPAGRVAKTPLSGYNNSYFLNALSAPESAALTVRKSTPRGDFAPAAGRGFGSHFRSRKARRTS